MSSEVLVSVEDASKKFCRSLRRSLWYGVQDICSEFRFSGAQSGGAQRGDLPASALRDGEFWAVDGVSFELRRGECLGLIGRNGAGKTTLLKMLNGLIKPDRGRIEMKGRVSALIALGAGFNPILTGRENIFVNGSVLGLTRKEIDEKLEDIIDFAEIRDFIDAPVQSYSSGMQVRLGFAIASALRPDVLILDEILAVGDINFTIKCLNKVRDLAARAAVIFVSHNMQLVSSFCTRVIVLKGGRALIDTANAAEGVDCYYSMIELAVQTSGTGEAAIHELQISSHPKAARDAEPVVRHGEAMVVTLDFSVQRASIGATVTLYVMDEAMAPVICLPVRHAGAAGGLFGAGRYRVHIEVGKLELNTGKYSYTVAVADRASGTALVRSQGIAPFRVLSDKVYWGKIVRTVTATAQPAAERVVGNE